ncbi:hypothetical protein K440DRAFT_632688 [Wilcoxina mikolae CBS 423.85]|nr:hypothetical protein K440DRAFT_632688 [Wilcoxina mikolae CBS 423.85]
MQATLFAKPCAHAALGYQNPDAPRPSEDVNRHKKLFAKDSDSGNYRRRPTLTST